MVFAREKFRPYILGSHVVIHTDHATIKYLKEGYKTQIYQMGTIVVGI